MKAQRRNKTKAVAPAASGPSQNDIKKVDMLRRASRMVDLEAHGRKLVARHPRNPFCWKVLGLALKGLGRMNDAAEAYTKATELDPKDFEAHNNLGNTHRANGNIGDAVASHFRAAAAKPDYPEAYNSMGVTLKEMGHIKGAIDNYRKALSFTPDNPEMLNNLAVALCENDQVEAGVECYRRLLEIAPDYAQAHYNLGNLLREHGRLEDAEQTYRRALELQPEFSAAHLNLSNVVKSQGRLEEAVAHINDGLRLLMTDVHARQRAQPKKYMRQDPARKALQSLKNALEAEGVPFFLAYGTLLGIVRDGDLLPHDKDMDIGLPWDVERTALLHALTTRHPFKEHKPEQRSDADRVWGFPVEHPETNTAIDLFFFKPEANTLLSGFNHLPDPMLWRFREFAVGSLDWQGEAWPVPENPERFLEEVYGPGWRQPDPNFDTVVSGCNMEASSRDLGFVYGCGRLADRMSRREWEKAHGYCRQLLALRDDPFIAEVKGWLDTVIERHKEAA